MNITRRIGTNIISKLQTGNTGLVYLYESTVYEVLPYIKFIMQNASNNE